MRGKEELLARVGARTGLTRLIEAMPDKPSLFILNYHRVGDAQQTPYDSGVFSCTADDFEWQVRYLNQRFPILTLDQALAIIQGRTTLSRTSFLLTFDDGYLDNFELAFPILRKHGVSATFFLPTALVGTGTHPWWDVIAFIVKNSRENKIRLTYPDVAEYDLSPPHRARSIMMILRVFGRPSVTDPDRYISDLEAACSSSRPADNSERRFLDWDEAREMQRDGMCFGSHTHTHPILSKLSYERQVEELQISRSILERELGCTIDTLAYPVGHPYTFSHDTFMALRQTNYTAAFSFYSGINRGNLEPYDVFRAGISGENRSVFRLRVALRVAMGIDRFAPS